MLVVEKLWCLTELSFAGKQTAAADYDFPSSAAEENPSAV